MKRHDFRSCYLALAIIAPLFGLTACDTPQELGPKDMAQETGPKDMAQETGPKIVSATPSSIVIENIRTKDDVNYAAATATAHCARNNRAVDKVLINPDVYRFSITCK